MLSNIAFNLASHIRPYTVEIAVALIATSLIIFGANINSGVRTMVQAWNVVMRVIVFILLCAVGYGLLTTWLTTVLLEFLRGLSNEMFLLVVSAAFIAVGIMAERNRWK